LVENVTGAFALGVLMVFVLDVWPSHRYLRPFLGVGVLGGYTTFSTYMLDTRGLLADGHDLSAVAYLFGSLVLGLLAVAAGVLLARVLVQLAERRRRRRREQRSRQRGNDRDDPTARSTR
jgi:CrcB protein